MTLGLVISWETRKILNILPIKQSKVVSVSKKGQAILSFACEIKFMMSNAVNIQ